MGSPPSIPSPSQHPSILPHPASPSQGQSLGPSPAVLPRLQKTHLRGNQREFSGNKPQHRPQPCPSQLASELSRSSDRKQPDRKQSVNYLQFPRPSCLHSWACLFLGMTCPQHSEALTFLSLCSRRPGFKLRPESLAPLVVKHSMALEDGC